MPALLRELRLPGAPRWLWLLLALAATAPFWDLGHPLLEVDDARYAEVPREMAAGGDWATPHLNGLDYVEKPPLWYWLCAASYKAFGVNEAAARLPLALLALLAMLGTAWLGSWLFSAQAGWTAALLLGTSGLFLAMSHYITPDLGLTAWLLWCSAFILRALLRPGDAAWAAPAAWAAAALAVLSKGLIGLIFPALWAASLCLLMPQLRPRVRALLRPAGPALFLLIAAPWFIIMERRHPGFWRFFFYEHHVLRFTTEKFNRDNPWYFFPAFLPACLLPWTPAIAAGTVRAFHDWRRGDGRGLALATWAALITAFFSCSRSKLITYILPVFPHLALLGANAIAGPLPAWARRLAQGTGAALLLAAAAALPAARFIPAAELPFAAAPVMAAAAIAALGISLLCCGKSSRALIAGAAAGLLAGGLGLAGMRAAAGSLSSKDIAAAINQRRGPADLVYVFGTYPHGLPFYTGRRVDRMLNWLGEMEYADRDERVHRDRFGGENFLNPMMRPKDRGLFVVCSRKEAPYVLGLNAPDQIFSAQPFGPWVLVEYRTLK